MFYEPKDGHGLPHNPINACVVPRPIGWITTLSSDGTVNLAPFSFFNLLQYVPTRVMFSVNGPHKEGGIKDSPTNAEETGEFVYNMATYELREEVNASSAHVDRSIDEMELVGLEKLPSRLVKPPRVARSPIQMECKTFQVIDLPSPSLPGKLVIGEVVGVHIADEVLKDGLIDVAQIRPLARLGYLDFADVSETYAMPRPD
jgi:flavin reductase (DIM6/NTAB) family NADH-FMN oxidoreductase RutF